jgi:hypothetical protein
MKNDYGAEHPTTMRQDDFNSGAALAFSRGRADGWAHVDFTDNYHFQGAYQQGKQLGIFERENMRWQIKSYEDLLTTAKEQDDCRLAVCLAGQISDMRKTFRKYIEGGYNAI